MTDQPTTDQLDMPGLTAEETALAAGIAARVHDLGQRIKALQEAQEEAKTALRALLKPAGEAYRAGPVDISISQPTRFDPARAKLLLSPQMLAEVSETVTVINEDLAKAKLSGELFAACRGPYGKARVSVSEHVVAQPE
jgi:hypothetical protein